MPLTQGIHNVFELQLLVIKGYYHGFVVADLEFLDAFDFFEDSTYPLRRTSGGTTGNGHPDFPFSGKSSLIRQGKQHGTDKQDIHSFHESPPGIDYRASGNGFPSHKTTCKEQHEYQSLPPLHGCDDILTAKPGKMPEKNRRKAVMSGL